MNPLKISSLLIVFGPIIVLTSSDGWKKFVGNKDIYDENVFIAFLFRNYLSVHSNMAVLVWLVNKIVPHFGLLVAVALFIK